MYNNNNIVLYILSDVFIFCIIILLQTLFGVVWLAFFDVSITFESRIFFFLILSIKIINNKKTLE